MHFLVLNTDQRGVHRSRVVAAGSDTIARLMALQQWGWAFEDTQAEPYDHPLPVREAMERLGWQVDRSEETPSQRLYIARWKDHNGAEHQWQGLASSVGEAWVHAVRMGADYHRRPNGKPNIVVTPVGT